MIDPQIQKHVEDSISQYFTNSQYSLTKIPSHSHNGIDSNKIEAMFLAFSKGYMILPNLSADPTDKPAGGLAVVGGKLKVCTGSAWVIVGTQS